MITRKGLWPLCIGFTLSVALWTWFVVTHEPSTRMSDGEKYAMYFDEALLSGKSPLAAHTDASVAVTLEPILGVTFLLISVVFTWSAFTWTINRLLGFLRR